MANFSFDIVSDYDLAKVTNAVEQSQRDIGNRYDFKGTSASLEFVDDKKGVKIIGDSQFHLDSIIEILRKKGKDPNPGRRNPCNKPEKRRAPNSYANNP